MTCGLHTGWAIEGAIGSEFKIDALHLSPDAMIAYRIEEMCATYGTSVLLSEQIQKLVSDKGKNTLRLIDKVEMDESLGNPRVRRFLSLLISLTLGNLFLRYQVHRGH